MPFNRRKPLFAAVSIYLACTGVWMARSVMPAQSETASETPKQVYDDRCSACHNIYDPAVDTMTMAQWRRTVNRMLYQHGASAEITPADTQTILTYLATFALPEPKTGLGFGRNRGSARVDNSDVWAAAPTYSRAFVFGTDNSLASTLQPASSGIAWKVLDSGPVRELAIRAKDDVAGPDLLLMPNSSAQSGGWRLEAVFNPAQINSLDFTPLTFGLAFGSTGSGTNRQYDIVRYDAKQGVVDLVSTNGKAAQTLAAKTLDLAVLAANHPAGGRVLRVDVIGNRVKAWLDYNKVLDATLPQAPASLLAGVWTGSRASVKSVTVDSYAGPV